jgi:hypothetical protein
MRFFKAPVVMGMAAMLCWGDFDPSKFNFGSDWDFLSKNQTGSVASAIDYATIWLNDPSFNQYWHGEMLTFCKNKGITPVFYSYIVAKASGLGDADAGGKLDQQGGQWLKGNINTVLQRYENYAQTAAGMYGTDKPIIWLMEPDYYQYCNGYGSDISVSEAAGYMKQMIAAVKKYLPNAVFSLDISPWNNDQANYIKQFDMTLFSFMSTSGGRTSANGDRIRNDNNNNVTWTGVNSASGKCIIADAGYGSGGGATGEDPAWNDANNIKNRVGNGVVAITQKSPGTNWGNTITSLKSSLGSLTTKCAGLKFKTGCSLTLTVGANGTVTKSPDASTYDSGATVTLTALPNSGYKFAGWSGDAGGSSLTLTVKMDKDKSITAAFIDVNAKPAYSLSIQVTGSGVVKVTPEKAQYDSGTSVTIEAFRANGGLFGGWGGAITGGGNPQTIVMTENKTITATFTGQNIILVNLVKNGSFTDGTTNWNFSAQQNAKATGAVSGGEFAVTLQTAGTAAWHIQLMQTGISLTKDKKYVFSFYGSAQKTTGIVANVGMSVDPYTSYSQERQTSLSSAKTKYSYSFTMTAASTTDARVEFNGGQATSSWTIDDVKLEEDVELISCHARPAPEARTRFGADEQVTVSWFDLSGRRLLTASGKYRALAAAVKKFSGSLIAVISTGENTVVRRMVNLSK